MPSKSVLTLSASSEDKAALLALMKRHGYSSQSRFVRDIAHGIIPLGNPEQPPPDLRLTVQALEQRIEGLEQRLHGLTPTDLP